MIFPLKNVVRTLAIIVQLVAVAAPGVARAQNVSVEPSNIPVDAAGVSQPVREVFIIGSESLDPGEEGVLGRALDAAADYVQLNPDLAPQLAALRDCHKKGRVRRANLELPYRMKTLPDTANRNGDSYGERWTEPGGAGPGGGVLPPNTLQVGNGELDGPVPALDPLSGCFQRAEAIMAVIHEGGRQLASGTLEIAAGGATKDCPLLQSMFNIYKVDIRIWTDFVLHGVPLQGGSTCALTPAEVALAEESIESAFQTMDALCEELKAVPCPLPPECNS